MESTTDYSLAADAETRFRNDIKEWISSDFARISVSEEEDKIVGYVRAYVAFPPPVEEQRRHVFLEELFVRDDCRKKGIATLLVEDIRSWKPFDDIGAIRLGTPASNNLGRAFWEAVGAKEWRVYYEL